MDLEQYAIMNNGTHTQQCPPKVVAITINCVHKQDTLSMIYQFQLLVEGITKKQLYSLYG